MRRRRRRNGFEERKEMRYSERKKRERAGGDVTIGANERSVQRNEETNGNTFGSLTVALCYRF